MTGSQRLTAFAALATALAAVSLHTVLATATWLLPVLFGIAAVAVAAQLARGVGVPGPLVPVVGLLAGGLYVNGLFASSESWLRIIPTHDSVRALETLATQGFKDIDRFAAPVTPVPGITMLTTAGVILVAVLVDTFAVTARRPALAGLPLLGLYTVPAAVAPDGVSWQSFVVGSAGFLALLLAESRERVSRWGRRLVGSRARSTDASPLAALGRRVGFAAVGLAVVVPSVTPGLGDGVVGWATGGGIGGKGRGTNAVEVENPILSMRADLAERTSETVLQYTTTTGNAPNGFYLRLVVLDEFTGNEWSPPRLTVPKDQTVDKGLAAPPGLAPDVPTKPVGAEIRVADDFDTRWLPLPYAARRAVVDEGRWLYDQASFNVYSSDTTTRGRRYTVESIAVQPTREQLDAGGMLPPEMDRYLQVPADTPASVRETAERQTADADTAYGKALALQTWLRSDEFEYTVEAPSGSGPSAVADFLTAKKGFCVQFASTMAIMSRQLGIPARVATGYLPGTRDPNTPNTFTVTRQDAHAWPELYFPNVGWVAFEPTPQARTGVLPDDYRSPGPAPGEEPSAEPTDDKSGATDDATSRENPKQRELTAREQDSQAAAAPVLPPVPPSGPPWGWITAAAVVVLVALAPGTARRTVRRRRWAAASSPLGVAETAWSELADTAEDYGYSRPAGLTPRQYADRLGTSAALDGEAAAALQRLRQRTERARYARRDVVPLDGAGRGAESADAAGARSDVEAVARALHLRAPTTRRLRAAWLPASTTALVHRAGERTADVLDWVDQQSAALRRRLLPARRAA